MKKKSIELLFKHNMALAFRSGTPAKDKSTFIGQYSGDQSQSAKGVLSNLKRAGLKESSDGLLMEFVTRSQAARINDGALLDVNQRVLWANVNSRSMGGGVVQAVKLVRLIKAPCPKCPYNLGLVHTVVNPCPQCKENGYQTFKRFQKQASEDFPISKGDDTHQDICSGCPGEYRIMPCVSDIFYL